MTQGEKISELEEKYKTLENLVYKVSQELTPRVWKLENPSKRFGMRAGWESE